MTTGEAIWRNTHGGRWLLASRRRHRQRGAGGARAAGSRPLGVLILLALLPTSALADVIDARLVVSSREITTVGRVSIDLTADVDPGWTLQPWLGGAVEALEGAGWTVVSSSTDAPALAGDGDLRHAGRVTIEPFLEGTYEIPRIELAALGPGGERATAEVAGETVVVTSVLPEGERDSMQDLILGEDVELGGGDDPLGSLREPPEPGEERPVLLWLGIALAIVAVVVLFRLLARLALRRSPARPDPLRDLNRLARRASSRHDLDRVEHAFRRAVADAAGAGAGGASGEQTRVMLEASGVPSQTSRRAVELLESLESARYAREASMAEPGRLARQAAAIARELRRSAGGTA